MTPYARERLEYALREIQQMRDVSTGAKLLAVREAIRSMLPVDSYIAKAAAEQLPPTSIVGAIAPFEFSESPEANRQLEDLIDATLSFLPAVTEPTRTEPSSRLGSNEPELTKLVETEVRLALNERFMASWIFKGVIGALALALTVFSFGL